MFAVFDLSSADLVKKAGQASLISCIPAVVGGAFALAIGTALRSREEDEETDTSDIIDGEIVIEHDSEETQD